MRCPGQPFARTIADLDAADWIGPAHLAEAINHRSMDRQGEVRGGFPFAHALHQ
ncbi:hypothetical protein [Pseudodesulfovibrio pelocollis]|uniref:magnesium chelatase subunit ChlI family protein n=1 Tax=Pseudodesulfovibrio pelocollis TaxID=3051432 RepID=UPI00255B0406|nr:hypothetical protein [Pseudodesulfovibrio sp. SB368]